MTLDLLNEPLVQSDRGWHSLPELLTDMARGEIRGFPALRPHQRPAWHMFLVQLAVMALDSAGLRELPHEADDWRKALRSLTSDHPDDAPWHLIVPDLKRPAFLQPPDPGGLKWTPVATPDALDMLITSRNHDVKREIAANAAPQDWIFALVSLQTMEGFSGKDNYGTARMNGGSSSRVMIGLAPAHSGSARIDPSSWWARDTRQLIRARKGITGSTILWQEPWPDGESLALEALDPLFIDTCRRIRLRLNNGEIVAVRSTSKAARVAGKEAKGNTGDPWAPVHVDEGKSLTLGDQDWTHEVLARLFFSPKREWRDPPLARRHANEATEPMVLLAEAFSRGNSKTDGFKSRVIPIPQAMVRELFGERPKDIAPGILADIATVDLALRNALAVVAAGGDRDKVKAPHYARSGEARAALRRDADLEFFPELWRRLEVRTDDGFTPLRVDFLNSLFSIAKREFKSALPSIPCNTLMRPRAEARGWQVLRRGIHRALQKLTAPEVEHVKSRG